MNYFFTSLSRVHISVMRVYIRSHSCIVHLFSRMDHLRLPWGLEPNPYDHPIPTFKSIYYIYYEIIQIVQNNRPQPTNTVNQRPHQVIKSPSHQRLCILGLYGAIQMLLLLLLLLSSASSRSKQKAPSRTLISSGRTRVVLIKSQLIWLRIKSLVSQLLQEAHQEMRLRT